MTQIPRYALYFSPKEGSVLGLFAQQWLSRTAHSLQDSSHETPKGFEPLEHKNLIQVPRHYGFHATLKAPFELAAGKTVQDLYIGLEQFCASYPPFTIENLCLQQIGTFLALCPQGKSPELQSLHSSLLDWFQEYRAELSEHDKNRYQAKSLNWGQQRNLEQYGYPYTKDFFQFHFTLTGPLSSDECAIYLKKLTLLTEQIITLEIAIDVISLFSQQSRQEPFICIKSCELEGGQ